MLHDDTRHYHVQSWIDEMAKYLKKADPNHMITVGEEGFYTKGSAGESVNPGTGWASLTGQDFLANHASKAIDFAAAHIWPDNWEVQYMSIISLCCTLHCYRMLASQALPRHWLGTG